MFCQRDIQSPDRGGPETMYPEYRKKLTGAVAKRPAVRGGGD
jgi:hypothetical protein